MRSVVLDFARDLRDAFELPEPLVEIGARPAEGQEGYSDVRTILGAREHIGCDIQEGPGVDRIEDIHRLSFADGAVGTVVAFDTLEHVADPIRALEELHRVVRPGGVVAITSVMFFPIHAHPWDYWRFTPEGFDLLLQRFPSRAVFSYGFELLPEGVFGVGVKEEGVDLSPARFRRTTAHCERWGEGLAVDFGPVRMTVRDLWGHTLRHTGRSLARRSAALRRALADRR